MKPFSTFSLIDVFDVLSTVSCVFFTLYFADFHLTTVDALFKTKTRYCKVVTTGFSALPICFLVF